jgi:hypothetical protein
MSSYSETRVGHNLLCTKVMCLAYLTQWYNNVASVVRLCSILLAAQSLLTLVVGAAAAAAVLLQIALPSTLLGDV